MIGSWRRGRPAALAMALAIGSSSCGTSERVGEPTLLARGVGLPVSRYDALTLQADLYERVDGESRPVCDVGETGCVDTWFETTPIVRDAQGQRVDLEPMWGEQNGNLWHAIGGFDPGIYTVVGIEEVPGVPLDLAFTVGDWGEAEGFDPVSVVGIPYRLQSFWAAPGSDVSDLVENSTPLYFQVTVVEGPFAEFRLVARSDQGDCTVLRDSGRLRADGTFTWRRETLTVALEEADLSAEALWAEVYWGTGDLSQARGRAHGRIDTTALAPIVDPEGSEDSVCDLLASIGWSCSRCDAGDPHCLDAHAFSVVLVEEVGPEIDAELPWCGVDLAELPDFEIPSLDCDFEFDPDLGCGCSSAGGQVGVPAALAALWVGLLRRRRGRDLRRGTEPPVPAGPIPDPSMVLASGAGPARGAPAPQGAHAP